jgi:hypothetical protein
MLEKLSKMSVREAMITLAGGPPTYGAQARWLAGVAKKVGASYRTARSLWLSEIKDPEHWAAREIRRQAEIEKARREANLLATKFEKIAEGSNAHTNLSSSDIAALVHAANILRGVDRA